MLHSDLDPDPIVEFGAWLGAAVSAGVAEPTAMTLATATRDGRPSARVVLLKEVDDRGFVFVTHYDSRKGREIAENPHASLVFCWLPLERQVRVEGAVERCSGPESDRLFAARPREAQLGAWASPQSRPLDAHEALEARWQAAALRFPSTVPRPPGWGGLRLRPAAIEFWIGRPHRLHDRLRYERDGAGPWRRVRLAP